MIISSLINLSICFQHLKSKKKYIRLKIKLNCKNELNEYVKSIYTVLKVKNQKSISISILRFFDLPSDVSLLFIGLASPKLTACIRSAVIVPTFSIS